MSSKLTNIIFIVLQALLTGYGIFDHFMKVLISDPDTLFRLYIASQTLLILALFMAQFSLLRQDVANFKNSVDRLASATTTLRPLYQSEFYQSFKNSIDKANTKIRIAHLDQKIPGTDALSSSETSKYFNQFCTIVRKYPNKKFIRLERYTFEKAQWIDDIISALGHLENFSLYVLDPDPHERRVPYVSTQIVDRTEVYLVAVAKHDEDHEYRDLFLSGSDIAKLWQSYYDDVLLDNAIPLVEKGEVQLGNLDKVRKREGICSTL